MKISVLCPCVCMCACLFVCWRGEEKIRMNAESITSRNTFFCKKSSMSRRAAVASNFRALPSYKDLESVYSSNERKKQLPNQYTIVKHIAR